jgi:tRNA U38,U39,U40 pseudouridine synthase TruA
MALKKTDPTKGGDLAWVAAINALLPDCARLLGRHPVSATDFHAEVHCTQYRFEYMLPLALIMPPGGDSINAPAERIVRARGAWHTHKKENGFSMGLGEPQPLPQPTPLAFDDSPTPASASAPVHQEQQQEKDEDGAGAGAGVRGGVFAMDQQFPLEVSYCILYYYTMLLLPILILILILILSYYQYSY